MEPNALRYLTDSYLKAYEDSCTQFHSKPLGPSFLRIQYRDIDTPSLTTSSSGFRRGSNRVTAVIAGSNGNSHLARRSRLWRECHASEGHRKGITSRAEHLLTGIAATYATWLLSKENGGRIHACVELGGCWLSCFELLRISDSTEFGCRRASRNQADQRECLCIHACV